MNIGLIGVPGSGKTDLATKAGPLLTGTWTVIDDYVPAIERETNLSILQISNYLGNLYVGLGRYARERNARSHTDHVISCGTLIDTAVYTALDIADQARILSDERKAEEAPRVQAMMAIMACLYTDIFYYDHVFYLPASYIDKVGDDTLFLDQNIQAALGGFKLTHAHVLGDPESRVETVINIVEGNEVLPA